MWQEIMVNWWKTRNNCDQYTRNNGSISVGGKPKVQMSRYAITERAVKQSGSVDIAVRICFHNLKSCSNPLHFEHLHVTQDDFFSSSCFPWYLSSNQIYWMFYLQNIELVSYTQTVVLAEHEQYYVGTCYPLGFRFWFKLCEMLPGYYLHPLAYLWPVQIRRSKYFQVRFDQ